MCGRQPLSPSVAGRFHFQLADRVRGYYSACFSPKTKFSWEVGQTQTHHPSISVRPQAPQNALQSSTGRNSTAQQGTWREGPMELEGGREAEMDCEDEGNEEMEKHTMFCSHIRPSQCVAVGSWSRGQVHIEASAVRDGSWSSTVKCCVSWQRAWVSQRFGRIQDAGLD